MTRSPQLRRLHFLNALFAPLTGQDLYLAQQIDDAITTSLGEAETRGPNDPAFIAAAAGCFTASAPNNPPTDSSIGTPVLTTPGLRRCSPARA